MRSNVKIFYIVTSPLSISSFFEGHFEYFSKIGFSVTAISSPGEPLINTGLKAGIYTKDIYIPREISLIYDLKALYCLTKLHLVERPHITNFGTPKAGLLGGLAAFVSRTPVRIYMLYGLRLETVTGVKRVLLTLIECISCACAHRVVCVSPSLRDEAVRLRLTSPDKALVLADGSVNGVDVNRFAPTPELEITLETLRRKYGLNLQEPVIGFIGRLTRDKGIVELAHAFQKLQGAFPTARLLVVGEFEEGDPVPEEIRRQLLESGSVILTGFVDEPAHYYHLMDVFVLPTYREGYPTVTLEAAAASKPVVTTLATGARDSVIDGETGFLVPVGDVTALTEKISLLLEQPDLARRMGEAGQKRVERDFQPERIWQAMDTLYRDLLRERLEIRRKRLKRTFDVVVSSLALLVLCMPMVIIAALIHRRLGSPVLFSQLRPGKGGIPFRMYKFRSMTEARGSDGQLLSDAERLTPFGRFLRTSSLDEIPGLWNVLCGEMALVGPRPLLMQYLERYTPEQARRHEVLPGLTGWAQVNGRNAISWREKFKLDVWYVDNQSFWLDLRILWLTVAKVLKRDGISARNEATMPEFTGLEASDDG